MSTTDTQYALTPLMKQYYAIKAQHPDALLLFRAGDFYETFGQDAVTSSSILGITLTKRANGSASSVPLAGFPYHALDVYLPKLVMAGQRVAICEQLEDPKKAKGIVKRGVTELITPGITYNDNILSHKENRFLASVYFGAKGVAGVAFLDISTGEFYAAEGRLDYIDKLLSNLAPKEVIYRRSEQDLFTSTFADRYYSYRLDDWAWNESSNREKLLRRLDVNSLKGFGIESMPMAIVAAGAILYYLEYTEHKELSHINTISRLDQERFVWIDRYSIRNLELFHPLSEGGTSLTDVIDRTTSPMGARMLRRWISLPLRSEEDIIARHDVVETLMHTTQMQQQLEERLAVVGDMERIISKVAAARVNPRELVQLSRSLEAADAIRTIALTSTNSSLLTLASHISPCMEVRQQIKHTITPEPALIVGRGTVIANGVDTELDDLRAVSLHGKEYLLSIQQREIERTGINSLKISYNNVFGYYIEVRNAHKDKVPPEWIRKQTLVNAERYITEELKEYEQKILGAEGRISEIEIRIFSELVAELAKHIVKIKSNAIAVAEIDTLNSFAKVAHENNYVKPQIEQGEVIDIRDGRHPVIEQRLPIGEPYIPNDLYLDAESQQIIMITGPNMAGKSALLRQTALIVLMAQIGSYVPASSAKIGIVDRIFTRVGASDNISQGESTFMVEMLESANILNNISGSSLVLLDEIGRGTSTYDGISIAWAMVEYLHQQSRARTLFATHYHELNEMESQFGRVKNYNVSVREVDRKVIFLRKLVRGGTEHSFGIHVAKMAGMPRSVVERASEVLEQLERQRSEVSTGSSSEQTSLSPAAVKQGRKAKISAPAPSMQMSFFQLDDPVLISIKEQIQGLDINNLTPLEALNKLNEIRKLIGIK